MKTCWKCGMPKEAFYSTNTCADCRRAWLREWGKKNPDKVHGYQQRYAAKPEVKAKKNEAAKARYRANPDAWRDRNYRAKFGIGLAEYDALYAKQGGKCAICGNPPQGRSTRQLVVDHDHRTGAVRSLLCGFCNCGLGYFKDNPVYLQRAIDYLKEQ